MNREHVIYTRSWVAGLGRHFFRDVGRSVAFGFLLSLGFVFLVVIPLIVAGTDWGGAGNSIDSFEGSYPWGAMAIFLAVGVPLFVVCCWGALEVADDRHWEKHEPTVWDDGEAKWINSTVAFSHYLEERGSHIHSALVQYDDPRVAAHRMIDKVDDKTLQLYLSLLSAVQLERQRVRVASVEVKPKILEDKIRQG